MNEDSFYKLAPSSYLTLALIGLTCGFLVGPDFAINIEGFLFLMSGVLLALLFLFSNLYFRLTAIFLLAILFGAGYFQAFVAIQSKDNISGIIGHNVNLTGVIVEDVERDERHQKLTLGVLTSNKHKSYKGKVLLYLPRHPIYTPGQRLKFEGELTEPTVFESFDWRKYLEKEGIYALMFEPKSVDLHEDQSLNFVLEMKAWLLGLKSSLIGNINKVLPEPEAGLLAGILAGAKSSLSDDLLKVFGIVGLTHIIALSGYNISVIIRGMTALTARWPRRLSMFLGLVGISAFIIATGASASVVRAGIMAAVILLAERLGRKADGIIALLVAATLMALANPLVVRFDVGFQLSFVATAGLILFSDQVALWRWVRYVPKIFREHLIATLAALSLTTPLIIWYFGQISIVAPLANILVLPVIPIVMLVGFISALVGSIFPLLGQTIGFVVFALLHYIVAISRILADIPLASIAIERSGLIYITAYLVIISLLFFYAKRSKFDINKT